MAKVPSVQVKVSIDAEPLRATLYELLQALGHEGAADALYAAPGVLTIPRSMTDTRDGREEIISMVQEAFEDDKIGVILIKDGGSVAGALESLGFVARTPTQGYS